MIKKLIITLAIGTLIFLIVEIAKSINVIMNLI